MWAEIPLTSEIRDAVVANFGVDGSADAERLHGGEESASYRIGDDVVRLSPAWRDDAELEWCYAIATLASRVPEAVGPIRMEDGRCVMRVDGRPVTVWPFVEGAWADKADDAVRRQAARLLSRLHRELCTYTVQPRPAETSPVVGTPDLDDPGLDAQIGDLLQRYTARQPLHGDFYRGNVLVDNGRVAGLVDWDNAFVGPPEQELAWAAWEWSDAREALDPSGCMEFVERYGGPAARIDEATVATFVRGRLRWEVAYSRAMRARGVETDQEYEDETVEAYVTLKRFTSPH